MSSLSRLLGVLLGCLAGALWPATATAVNQEPAGINLGATSFYDGFGRNEEGFTYLVYAQYAWSRQINGDDGNALTVCNAPQGCGGSSGIAAIPVFKNPKLDVYVLVNQLAYTLPNKLFNDSAHLGINFILPFIVFDTNFDHTLTAADVGKTLATEVRDNGAGFGDLSFGPFMQFRPLRARAPCFLTASSSISSCRRASTIRRRTSTRGRTSGPSTRTGRRPCFLCRASR
jgi:hypothetical protein